jgi:hypothetical protein
VTHGKYGYLPRDFSKPAPELESYLLVGDPRYFIGADPLPGSPSFVDRESKVASWPMYKNDSIGDCTVAGILHAVSSMTAFSGAVPGGAMFTDAEAVKIYSAVSGYDPVTGANDNGATLADVCKYMVATGAKDVNGRVHKLAAWAEANNYTDLRLLKRVTNAFGSAYLAINCPYSALDQFNAGQPWTYVPGSQIDGGHAIPLQYSAVNTGTLDDETVITWGAEQKVAEAFFRNYLVEAVAIVSADDVNVQTGKNPVGLDLTTMIADCQSKYLT